MSERFLLVEIRLHDDRWHGAGEWPPSPFRLFQALLAAACLGRGETPVASEISALDWLAELDAPVIAVPTAKYGQGMTLWVPNNDLDAVGGDLSHIGKIRTGKAVRPRLLEQDAPFLYVWPFENDADHAETLIRLADRLYQFGRGVDMAYARAEVIGREKAEAQLAGHPGPVWRPAGERSGGGLRLRCPGRHSLRSLIDRQGAQIARLKEGTLRQAAPPRFRMVGYGCPPTRLLFDLRFPDQRHRFHLWPLTRAAGLTMAARDGAMLRLKNEIPSDASKIERTLVGRNATEADKAIRVRIIPLPSIGSPSADPAIRRVLVESPSDCPIRADDLSWAFSGLDLGVDYETGEVVREGRAVLTPSDDRAMLRHYGVEAQTPTRVWRTVTPAALPVRRRQGHASGPDRSVNEGEASHAASQALRHAGFTTPVETICVRREPFFSKGARAEAFSKGSRFEAARLWHLEITFAEPIFGPLVIGDGRYCGLGLMAPVKDCFRDAMILWMREDIRPPRSHRATVVEALRRALMSRAADPTGRVSTLFSGHESGPDPARSGRHRHVYLFADDNNGDGFLDRIGVIAPWRVDRSWRPSNEDRALFENDLLRECLWRGLPRPEIEVTRLETGPRGGISAKARLRFNVAVAGPILLGRDAHRGGGLFAGER